MHKFGCPTLASISYVMTALLYYKQSINVILLYLTFKLLYQGITVVAVSLLIPGLYACGMIRVKI